MVNLSSFIRYHATRTPQRIAIVYQDQRVTFAELLARIEKTAGYLAARGIGPDDVVAVMMKNSIAFLEIAFAVSHLGAVFLPINFRLAADEVEYIAGNAGAKLVFADAEFADGGQEYSVGDFAGRGGAGRHHDAFRRSSARRRCICASPTICSA